MKGVIVFGCSCSLWYFFNRPCYICFFDAIYFIVRAVIAKQNLELYANTMISNFYNYLKKQGSIIVRRGQHPMFNFFSIRILQVCRTYNTVYVRSPLKQKTYFRSKVNPRNTKQIEPNKPPF